MTRSMTAGRWRMFTALRPRRVRTGHWFADMLEMYLQTTECRSTMMRSVDPRLREEGLDRIVRRASATASLLGSGAAGVATGAALVTAESYGLGALIAVPVAGTGLLGDLALRTLTLLRMTSRLGELHGVDFGPEEVHELARLYALILGVLEHEEADDPGRGLVERTLRLDARDAGAAVGAVLFGETLVRDLIPFLGVPLSAWQSWRLTHHIGDGVRSYLQQRQAIEVALTACERVAPQASDILVQGIWFVFIADGRLTPVKAAVLAQLAARQSDRGRAVTTEFVVDDQPWLHRLGELPDEARTVVLEGLIGAAAADRVVPEAEQALLQRAAEAMGRRFEAEEIRPRA